MIINELIKSRSHAGCISSSAKLYSDNLSTIFKKTWLITLLASICFSAISFLPTTVMPGQISPMMFLGIYACYLLLLVIVSSCAMATFAKLVNGESYKHTLTKCTAVTATQLVTLIVATTAVYCSHQSLVKWTASLGAASSQVLVALGVLVVVAVFFVLLSPLAYTHTKYILENGSKYASCFGKPYSFGMKNCGYIILSVIVALLELVLSIFLFSIPFIVCHFSSFADFLGTLDGDTSGLPSYFNMLVFGTNIVFCFLTYYVVYSIFLLFCFVYGNIEAKRIGTAKDQSPQDAAKDE